MKKKIYTAIVLSIIAVTMFSSIFLTNLFRKEYIVQKKEELFEYTYLVEKILDNLINKDYPEVFDEIFNNEDITGLRLTLIRKDGYVLYDSEVESSDMSNHLYRKEVQKALEGSAGTEIRYSTTLKKEMLYVAIPYKSFNHEIDIIRISVPVENLFYFMNFPPEYYYFVILSIILIIFTVNRFFIRYFFEPVKKVSGAIKRMGKGIYGEKIYLSSAGEIGELINGFNETSEGLEKSIIMIKRERDRYRLILSCMKNGVLVLDESKKILFSNRFSENIFGKNLIGRNLIEVIRSHELYEFVDNYFKNNEKNTLTENVKDRIYKIKLNDMVNETSNRLVGIIMILEDITEIKKTDKIRKDFTTNVTHELRTPLTSIKGFIEILKENEVDTETRKKFMNIIEIETDRLIKMINDILILAEIENIDEKKERVMLSEIIRGTFTVMQPVAAAKRISLQYDIDEDISIYGTESRIKEMFINLTDNGIKYGTEGGYIKISAFKKSGRVNIIFEDNGIGIERKNLTRIFERFFRADRSRAEKEGSTGLGLAIVNNIVKIMDGEIRLESTPGQGTKFTIIFPEIINGNSVEQR